MRAATPRTRSLSRIRPSRIPMTPISRDWRRATRGGIAEIRHWRARAKPRRLTLPTRHLPADGLAVLAVVGASPVIAVETRPAGSRLVGKRSEKDRLEAADRAAVDLDDLV